MDRRPLITFPLSPSQKTALVKGGLLTLSDLKGVDKIDITQVTGLNSTEVEDIFHVIEETSSHTPKPISASQLLKSEEENQQIVSFCQKLDEVLGGGVPLGCLTEISGLPGVGKTQLCLQLSCDVQIPAIFGGLEGEAIFIDTEGGFVTERITEVVMATVNHCKDIAKQENDPELKQLIRGLSTQKMLSGLHVYKCHSEQHLLAIINLLPCILQENTKVKLVVIDSVAFHYRHDFDDLSLRTRILTNLVQTLLSIARMFNISVVVTNQMTTKVKSRSHENSCVVPALGDSWGHSCTHRITLEYGVGCRLARLKKSSTQKQGKAFYQITKDGFRDSVMSFDDDSLTEEGTDKTVENPSKRQRCS